VNLTVADTNVRLERRWLEPGAKTKVFVDGKGFSTGEFQDWLLEALNIPLLHFPRGNPMSGQTWPELSFRMLLRHLYRQQRFWGDLADRQPEPEQVACVLQFLGIAEKLYTEGYAQLIRHKMEVERLRARREQYNETLGDVARDIISEPNLTVSLTVNGVQNAKQQIEAQIERMRSNRITVLEKARDTAFGPQDRSRISRLTERRAELVNNLEATRKRADETDTRLSELGTYKQSLSDEINRMDRASDAGSVLADLKITHCPACDQTVVDGPADGNHCFLCHQPVQSEPILEELGAVRLRFEKGRLSGELKETLELSDVLGRDSAMLAAEIARGEEELAKIEDELIPARTNVGGLAQAEVSKIDMALGQAGERQRQIERVLDALDLGRILTEKIRAIEKEIEPLQERVEAQSAAIDYEAAASELEDGMNDYLNAINTIRPGCWNHNAISVLLSRSRLDIRVGKRRWQSALGGTDTLYFLMAYQFGLLTLSSKDGSHYPGLSIIDVPGEFSGEAIEDKENFIIQPFIDLVTTADYEGVQVVITGASFKGLDNVNRLTLTGVHTA
jgi:predicted  nucleic acid-binding Zn-ribbon protein